MKRLYLLPALALLIGCGGGAPDKIEEVYQPSTFDVGGAVVASRYTDVPLDQVTVTLANQDEQVFTGTTDASGRWLIANVPAGVYMEEISRDHFEDQVSWFVLEAVGENDFDHRVVSRGVTGMDETPLIATALDYGVELRHGDRYYDGSQKIDANYDLSTGGGIRVGFNLPLFDETPYIQVRMQTAASGTMSITGLEQADGTWLFPAANLSSCYTAPDHPIILQIEVQGLTTYFEERDYMDADLYMGCSP